MPRSSTHCLFLGAARMVIQMALPVLLSVTGLPSVAAAGKLGLIGDSMMVATNADQMCGSGGEVLQCFENKLGNHDLAFSHGGGDQPWSIAGRLGFTPTRVVNAADDGEEWKDALAQAQRITADPEVDTVFIALGANDVCADYGHDFAGDLEDTAREIDATLSHLVNSLPAGARIYWSGVVDVVGFRDRLADRRHNFAFDSCQGLWDLDPDALTDEAVRSLCKDLDIPNDACEGLAEFDAIREPLLEALIGFYVQAYDVEAPCGAVLDGRNSAADRERARAFNIALNRLLEDKARFWSESQSRVDVVFTNRVFDVAIEPYSVSRLDCFHPSRAGQMKLAEEIWGGFEPLQAGNVSFFVDEFDSEDPCAQEFTTWASCWYDAGDPGFTVGVDGRNRLELSKETSQRRHGFVARSLGDLSDKTSAWISFNHKRQYLDDGGDRVSFEVFADGIWNPLDVFQGGGNDRNGHPGKYYDLTPFLSSDVRIQLQTSNQGSMENGDGVRFDHFEVFAWGPTPLPEPAATGRAIGLLGMALAARAARRRRTHVRQRSCPQPKRQKLEDPLPPFAGPSPPK